MKVKLVVVGGKKAGMEIPISTPTFRIGRGDRCHLRPQSNLIGELHCLISVDGNSVALEDNGVAIGTFVNGKKVQQRCGLQDNDRIKIGALELEVRLAMSEADGKIQPKAIGPDHNDVDDILHWAKQEQTSSPPPMPLPEVAPLQGAKPEVGSAATQAAAALRAPKRVKTSEGDFELEPADRLLLLAPIRPTATHWALWRGCWI